MLYENHAQDAAIHTIDGPMIIIACPGSGKTTTLLHRIGYMLKEGIDPKNIIMVTFTRAAASEMKERFEKEYQKDSGVTFCTIHSLCYKILYAYQIEKPKIPSENDIKTFLMHKLKGEFGINDKKEFIKDLLLDFTLLKNSRTPLNHFKPKCTNDTYLFKNLYRAYEKYLRENKAMDMDDLLIRTLDLLKNRKDILEHIQKRFQYIQVDEYQDTNDIQKEILYLLAGEKKNIAVVGDDDQSIYGFRGANPKIMLDFPKDFPDCTMINLDTNYRSGRKIIRAADRIIKRNRTRFPKEFQGFRQEEGHIESQEGTLRKDEIQKMTKKIKILIQEGVNPNDIAILYRNNHQSLLIAEYCLKNGIPFKTTEYINSKYHTWMFFDLYAYHKLAIGEGTKYDLARILNHPMRYLFGDKFWENGLDKNYMKNFAKTQNPYNEWKTKNMLTEIDQLFSFLNLIKNQGPEDTIRLMNGRLNYKKYIKSYAEKRNIEPDDFLSIWEDFYTEARDIGKNNWKKWESYIRNYEAEMQRIQKEKMGITLSTMHKAKGLEWEHVFLADCVMGNHPSHKAVLPSEMEEERRLFYVAMTRAKSYLYFYYYTKNGNKSVVKSMYI